MHPTAGFSLRDQTGLAELAQMRRHRRGCQMEDLDDLAHTELAVPERGEHAQAHGVRQGLVDPDEAREGCGI